MKLKNYDDKDFKSDAMGTGSWEAVYRTEP